MRGVHNWVVVVALLVVGSRALAQDEAQTLWGEQRWGEAADAYRQVVEADPENAQAWFRLGYSLHADGRLHEALEAHRKAATFDEYRGIALYNLGCAQALLGHSDEALEALERSREAGFDLRSGLQSDPDLASLRDDPRFQALAARAGGSGGGAVGDRFWALVQQVQAFLQQNGPRWMAQAQMMAQRAVQMARQAFARFQERASELSPDDLEDTLEQLRQQSRAAQRGPDLPTSPRPMSAPSEDEVRQLLEQQRWTEAAAALDQVVQIEPQNSQAWFYLGYALHMDGRLEEAIKAHQKAATFDEFRGVALYNLGCAYALTGKKDEAFGALRKSHEAGFDLLNNLDDDPDLKTLRGDERYKALMDDLLDGSW